MTVRGCLVKGEEEDKEKLWINWEVTQSSDPNEGNPGG